jgi:hypothetical protein
MCIILYRIVERRVKWSQSDVALYNQINGLCTVSVSPMGPLGLYISEYLYLSVIQRSHHLMSSAVSQEFSIWSILLLLLLLLLFIIYFFPNWIKWLGHYLQYLVCVGHIELWILFRFIILLFSRLIRDLDMSKGLSPLAPDWYRESRELSFNPRLVQRVSHFVIISFSLLRIVISLHRYDNWGRTLIHLFYIVR